MHAQHRIARIVLTSGLALLAAASAFGVRRTEDPLALVPANAATVGVIHWSELRSSPLGAQVCAQMDHVSTDGDAARFLAETGLTPREDIDTVVVAMTRPGAGESGEGLVIFEGRFDLTRISGALVSRGATKQTGPSGEYYRLADEEASATAPWRSSTEPDRRGQRGGRPRRARAPGVRGRRPDVRPGTRQAALRVDRDASAWALMDLTRSRPRRIAKPTWTSTWKATTAPRRRSWA
jgi:hypothetical protein